MLGVVAAAGLSAKLSSMPRRPLAFALCLLPAGFLWSLEPDARQLAGRYLAILEGNPAHTTAFERLWKIYEEAGETSVLVNQARAGAAKHPMLSARILERAGEAGDARKLLADATAQGDATATAEFVRLMEKSQGAGAAAGILENAPALARSPELLVRLGGLWQQAGDGAKARAAWERAARLSPDDLALRRKLADAAFLGGDPAAAAVHLRVIAERGAPAERFAALEEISLREEEAGHLDAALAAQTALLDLMGPGHWKLPSARRRLFELRQHAGTLAELEAQWTAEASQRARDPEPALRLSDLYEFQGDNAQSLARLRQASALLPKDASLLARVAALELLTGQLDAAAQSCDQALALRPGDTDLIFQRAEVAALAGDEAGAERQIEAFLQAHPGDENAETQARNFYQRLHLPKPLERRLAANYAARPRDKGAALTLARFFLDEYRFPDAAACLARFDDSRLSPGEAAETAREFGEFFSHAGMTGEALAWTRKAWEKHPADVESALALAGLLGAQGNADEARTVLAETAARSAGSLPKEELDRRLFLALQTQDNDNKTAPGLAVAKMIGTLRAGTPAAGADGWLRLSRWQRWKGDLPGAITSLQEGLQAFPEAPALYESLGDALVSSGQAPRAVKAYSRLAQLSPERSLEMRRKIARVQLDGENIPLGLAAFDAIARENPQDWQAVSDLALAEQVAGNWYEAMETWLRASRLAPPEARRGMRQPILNAAARLQMHERALDYLEQACEEEGDPDLRNDLLREAAAFAVRHNLAANWRERLERRAEKPWKMGRVFLLEEEGRAGEARRLLAQILQNDDEGAALTLQLDAAEKSGDWTEAVRLARRLVTADRQDDSARWKRLAEDQDHAGDATGASRTWEIMATRFSRDAAVLAAAAEFFERTNDDDRMEKARRAASRIGSCAPEVFYQLGELALDRGDRSQALADFEAVLARTQPDLQTVRPPVPNLTFASDPDEAAKSASLRLLAIRQVARLLANSPEKPRWLTGFSAGELAWALFYSGEATRALDEMERLEEKETSWEAGFAALAWEAGEGKRLARWAQADPAQAEKRWDQVLVAFSGLLDAGWKPPAAVIGDALGEAPALKRWEACLSLVSRRFVREACALGESVPAILPASQASPAWIKLAEWRVALREPDQAVACLDRAIASASPAVSYANPLFSAIRARWLLSNPEERPDFIRRTLASLRTLSHPGCLFATEALLAALDGDPDRAEEKLRALFTWREISGGGDWQEFIQQGGTQLEEWGLPRLARALYRLEWQGDRALAALRGQDMQHATRTLFVFNRLAGADPAEIPYLLAEWTARGVTDQELLLAARARRISPETSALLYQMLCDREPNNEILIAAILAAAPTPQVENYLQRLLAGDQTPGVRARMVAAGLQRSAALEDHQEYERALRLVVSLRDKNPSDAALLRRHARILEELGRHREALTELEKGPRSPDAESALTALRIAFGREAGPAALPAPVAAEKPAPKTPAERYDAGSMLLRGNPDLPAGARARELGRLGKIAAKNPSFLPRFYLLRKNLAESRHELPALERELWPEWKAGDYFAGEILLQLCLEQQRYAEIGGILDTWLTDVFFRETAWQNVGTSLLAAGQPELAARVFGELLARAPSNTAAALLLAQALWKSNRAPEADAILSPLRRIARLDPGYRPGLAHFALATNQPDEAVLWLENLPQPDLAAARLWIDAARQFLAAGKLPAARSSLVHAAPFSPDGLAEILADYSAARGELAQLDPTGNDLNLDVSVLPYWQITMAGRLIAAGNPGRAWLWFEANPQLLNLPDGRMTLESLEKLDPARAARLWEAAVAQIAPWDTRRAAAQFYLRRAQEDPANALKNLTRAHELHPGSFAIAKAAAAEYLKNGRPEAARKLLQEVIDSYAEAADRQAAREMLATLQAAPALPDRG